MLNEYIIYFKEFFNSFESFPMDGVGMHTDKISRETLTEGNTRIEKQSNDDAIFMVNSPIYTEKVDNFKKFKNVCCFLKKFYSHSRKKNPRQKHFWITCSNVYL